MCLLSKLVAWRFDKAWCMNYLESPPRYSWRHFWWSWSRALGERLPARVGSSVASSHCFHFWWCSRRDFRATTSSDRCWSATRWEDLAAIFETRILNWFSFLTPIKCQRHIPSGHAALAATPSDASVHCTLQSEILSQEPHKLSSRSVLHRSRVKR